MSANTGVAPSYRKQFADAAKLNGDVIASSPGLRLFASDRDSWKFSVDMFAPNFTAAAPESPEKPVPVITTDVPPAVGPAPGASDVTDAARL